MNGALCAQFAGDTYCATACDMAPCTPDRSCMPLTSAEGNQVSVCVPITDVCHGPPPPPPPTGVDASVSDADASTSTTTVMMCGVLAGPTVHAMCHSCTQAQHDCQPNGCYGGWWCNTQTVRCQSPPDPATCGASPDAGSIDAGPRPDGGFGNDGGHVDVLRFAIVGDTRPATQNDTDGYPTGIITQIWQDIESFSPPLVFAVSTGDYMFADADTNAGNAQLDLYLGARAIFSGFVFPVMGNQECTGATSSNCGPGTDAGVTQNYAAFLNRMMTPLGQTNAYYSIRVDHSGGAWTSKFVFLAANAWSQDQGTWLDGVLSQPTTYTFIVRHEGSYVTSAPGVSPSAAIMARHPYTMLIAGHNHTFSYSTGSREVIVGIGGAPLSSSVNYGYVIAEQQPNETIVFSAFDYATRAVFRTFSVHPDGTPGE
jgi:hypothetical protein